MLNLNDDTVLIGTTELRSKMPEISKNIKIKKIIVVKRGEPFAVLTDFEQYQEKEDMIDTFEDLVLGYLAKERDKKSSKKDFISSEDVEKKLGI